MLKNIEYNIGLGSWKNRGRAKRGPKILVCIYIYIYNTCHFWSRLQSIYLQLVPLSFSTTLTPIAPMALNATGKRPFDPDNCDGSVRKRHASGEEVRSQLESAAPIRKPSKAEVHLKWRYAVVAIIVITCSLISLCLYYGTSRISYAAQQKQFHFVR